MKSPFDYVSPFLEIFVAKVRKGNIGKCPKCGMKGEYSALVCMCCAEKYASFSDKRKLRISRKIKRNKKLPSFNPQKQCAICKALVDPERKSDQRFFFCKYCFNKEMKASSDIMGFVIIIGLFILFVILITLYFYWESFVAGFFS